MGKSDQNPEKIGQNLILKFSKKSAKFWQILQPFLKNQQEDQQFLTKKLRLEWFDSKTVQRSVLCRSRRQLFNEYLFEKFGFDTAENDPVYRRRRREQAYLISSILIRAVVI